MSNPTLAVADLQSDLVIQTPSGATTFTGVDPIRYSGGLWLEEATTNLNPNPLFYNNISGWGSFGQGSGISASLAWHASRRARWTVSAVDTSGGNYVDMGHLTGVGSFAAGEPISVSAEVNGAGVTGTIAVAVWAADAGGTTIVGSRSMGTAVAIDGADHVIQHTVASLPVGTSRVYIYVATRFSSNGGSGTVDCLWYQNEKKAYPTSLCPEVDGSGTPNAGYAFAGTAHASASTRAASSASVTIDEPVSVACWYREGYSGAKTFAYLEPYGTLGTYGSIAYAAGDLTISTSRNLVIGPFAAFDRALTAGEQANLRSTQNWTMNSVNGSNIILPLSGARRRRR